MLVLLAFWKRLIMLVMLAFCISHQHAIVRACMHGTSADIKQPGPARDSSYAHGVGGSGISPGGGLQDN